MTNRYEETHISSEQYSQDYPYGYKMYSQVGDRAIDKLANAMAAVLGFDAAGGGEERFNSMRSAASAMDGVANIISKTNVSLGSSWSAAAERSSKIEIKIASLMSDISKALQKYYEETHSAEADLQRAIDTFNDSMDNIDDELDGLGF